METSPECFKTAAAVIKHVSHHISRLSLRSNEVRNLLTLDGAFSGEDTQLCRLVAVGSREDATAAQSRAADLAEQLLAKEIVLNGSYIYGLLDEYFDAFLADCSTVVAMSVKKYRAARMHHKLPDLSGPLDRCIEAELIRTSLVASGMLSNAQLEIPVAVLQKVRTETSTTFWLAFGGHYCFETGSISRTSLASRFMAGYHLTSPQCSELLLEQFEVISQLS